MKLKQRLCAAAVLTSIALAAPGLRALVSLEDGKDRGYVDATVDLGYDSNVFANAQSGGSFVYEGTVLAELARRAGWIGVNVTAGFDFARYANFRDQDYVDPRFSAEFTKQTGRTTGSFTVNILRQDRADIDVNTRDTAWIYSTALDFQYPVIERYSISGSLGYTRTDYEDRTLFVNQQMYTGNLYLYYVLNEQRDLFIDARSRYTRESNGEYDIDRALSAGVSGRVYGPFNGSLQVGYQVRNPYHSLDSGTFNDFTASGSATWNMNRKMTLTAEVSRDYSNTAQALTVDATRGGLTFQDSLTAKASVTLQAAAGENRFLGVEGLTAGDGVRRVDTFVSFGAAYFYTINQHLKVALLYDYYRNWSTLAYAEFPRDQVTLELKSHW